MSFERWREAGAVLSLIREEQKKRKYHGIGPAVSTPLKGNLTPVFCMNTSHGRISGCWMKVHVA
jgi:hypothetical protein